MKCSFDVAFSLLALTFLIPFVFPLIALAIRLGSRGSIFFVQNRPGKRNQLFPCIKFRSMRANTESEKQASKNDMRITRVGAFLRETSLDELPQFINVLLGQMSVVGPRPNMVKQLEYYDQVLDQYSVRHFITPGITGWAQVNGYRGETHTDDLMQKRVDLDLEYMQKWSFGLDLKIIFLTVYNIFKGEKMAY
jgi:putative colanic acid biosynthesis UDP-glucose lipid carrier transferase